MKYPILFLCTYLLCSCSSLKDGKPDIKEGIYGQVLWQEGNLMPSPDKKNTNNGNPVKRKIRFYEVTNFNQAKGNAPLFDAVQTKLITETTSDAKGNFVCKLTPGQYSVFTVEEGNRLFANSFDGKGNIAVCEVKEGEVTHLVIRINYKAVH